MDGFFLSHQNKLGQPQKCTRILRQRSWLCAASDFLSISAHRTEMRGRLNPMELIQHTNTQKRSHPKPPGRFFIKFCRADTLIGPFSFEPFVFSLPEGKESPQRTKPSLAGRRPEGPGQDARLGRRTVKVV